VKHNVVSVGGGGPWREVRGTNNDRNVTGSFRTSRNSHLPTLLRYSLTHNESKISLDNIWNQSIILAEREMGLCIPRNLILRENVLVYIYIQGTLSSLCSPSNSVLLLVDANSQTNVTEQSHGSHVLRRLHSTKNN
jgi:hypothetical protein